MTVTVAWDVPETGIASEAAARAAEAALAHGGRAGLEVTVVFVDDPTLAELHARFLDDPAPTDVIAFDLEDEHGGPAAEIYVSVDRARSVAERRGVPLERELALYVVHGALHLCGMDDHGEADRRAMREAERAVLAGLGHASDDAPHELDDAPRGL